MMNEPDLLRLLWHGKYCCYLTKDEIMTLCSRLDDEELKMNWNIACVYFSELINDLGICCIPLEDLFDGNTLDQIRSTAVFMIVTTLMETPGKIETLPDQILERAIAYASVKLAEINYAIFKVTKENMLLSFECRAMSDLLESKTSDRSFDDCYDSIFSYIPSIECYSRLSREDKAKNLEIFELLLHDTKYCSTSYYEDNIKEYIEVLKG